MAARRSVVLAVAYAHVFLTSGAVFGWAALESFYDDLPASGRNRIFTIAASANYLSNLFFGPFLDKVGGVRCSFLACALMFLASLGMAAAELTALRAAPAHREALVALSFGLLGFAGPGVQMPTLRCELLFPECAGLVTSVNASLFDASCAVFLVFQLLKAACGVDIGVLFQGYAVLMLLCLASGQVLFGALDKAHADSTEAAPKNIPSVEWARNSLSTPKVGSGLSASFSQSLLGDADHGAPTGPPDSAPPGGLGGGGGTEGGSACGPARYTFAQAIRSPKFAYLITFCAILILRLNFVVMTVNAQLASFFSGATVGQLSLVFSTLLPLGGFAAPLTALLLDRYRRWSYRVCLALSILYGLCLAVPRADSQIVAFVIISVSRQLTYSIVFCMTSALFGQEHLGKLLACNNAAVFLVGLAQYPIAVVAGGAWPQADVFMVAISLPLLFSSGGL